MDRTRSMRFLLLAVMTAVLSTTSFAQDEPPAPQPDPQTDLPGFHTQYRVEHFDETVPMTVERQVRRHRLVPYQVALPTLPPDHWLTDWREVNLPVPHHHHGHRCHCHHGGCHCYHHPAPPAPAPPAPPALCPGGICPAPAPAGQSTRRFRLFRWRQ